MKVSMWGWKGARSSWSMVQLSSNGRISAAAPRRENAV